ncbi:hypothetical protein Micbo1qcDRAFT_166655 [Microdochium bolleyi]|uniref:Uncharacterized protein n=1 Tax=Microdochium bolleyi TaxID=196109 RepID=A0A136IUX0_9PEZI|nr:hypothetical protein Micbo1qcDRAFT_166655 [Microdochium bolleyi]
MQLTNFITITLATLASAAPHARRQNDTTPTSKCSGWSFYLQVDGVAIADPDQDPALQNGDGKYIAMEDRNNRFGTLEGVPIADNTTAAGGAALFRIDEQQRLVNVDSGKILNTFASYRSNQVYWDLEENIYGDWEAPTCWVVSEKVVGEKYARWSRHLRCEKNRQVEWSTCFATSEDRPARRNGQLYMTASAAGQGTDCGGVKLKVVYAQPPTAEPTTVATTV